IKGILILFYVFWATASLAQEADADRMHGRIDALSEFGANDDGGVDRYAFTDADVEARQWLIGEMEGLGLEVRVDTAGNIIGRREGSDPELPIIMFGSHIDSVPGGGNYDGDVGVISALEAIEILNARGITTRHPLEVINFTNEEGGLIGSLVLSGKMKPETLSVISQAGMTMGDGIDKLGGDQTRINEAAYSPGDLKAFIEVHIEQGAFLDEEGTNIGVVEGIVGIRWWDVVIEGFANHAGTTPMNRRKDAMLAAAQLTLAVNWVATTMPGRQVATVGRIQAFPGAPNVIPGRVIMSLEIRDLEADKIDFVFEQIKREAEKIAKETGTPIEFLAIETASEPAPTDERIRDIINSAAQELGYSTKLMPSGAGHDTQDMTAIAPSGMIFVPSKGGISHSPNEFTAPEDMARGANVLVETILSIDRRNFD
ncbi:MAG: Zn-dependent hydrolase, partial [Sphingomonadales bacterium]